MKKMFITLLGVGLLATLLFGGCSGKPSENTDSGQSSAENSGENGDDMISGGSATGSYVVSDVEALLSLEPKETRAIVIVKGYYAPGDGGGGTFYYDSASRIDENGGTVFKGKARGRFVRSYEENTVNVKWFGARGDGATDDTAAIQAAIDALPNGGGTVTIPGGTYAITSTINIGDGDAGEKISSKGGIKLIGMGGGFSHAVPASTSIIANAEMDSVIAVNGRISDVEIAGLYIGGNGMANTGLFLHSFTGGYFHNLNIIGFKEYGLKIMAGTAPTGNYNIYNRFESIGVFALNNNSTCLFMDGHYSDNNDTWLSVFTDCRFDTTQSENSAAAHFKFVDSISFYRCHFNTYKDSSVGAIFDALNNRDFPSGIGFYDCSVKSTEVREDADNKIRPQYFYGFGTEDGEEIPTHSKLIGVTDHGETFNMDDLDVFNAMKNNNGELDEYWLLPKSGRVDTYTQGYPEKHYNLKTGNTVAVLVNAKTELTGASFYLSSYGNNIGTVKLSVYRWNKDYETTVKGEMLSFAVCDGFTDNTNQDVTFEGLGTGYYLIVATGTSPEGDTGVAVWTQQAVSTSITFVNGERVNAGIRGSFITK